jgi:hypothetical protein
MKISKTSLRLSVLVACLVLIASGVGLFQAPGLRIGDPSAGVQHPHGNWHTGHIPCHGQ